MSKMVTKKIVGKYPLSFESPFWWIDYNSSGVPPRPIPTPGNFFLLENGLEFAVSQAEYARYTVGDMYSYESNDSGMACLVVTIILIGCWLVASLGILALVFLR